MNIFTNIQYLTATFFSTNIGKMNYTQKIYFIIQDRKMAGLTDLMEITRYKKITVLRAISYLLINNKIKSVDFLGTKYFVINPKSL